MKQTWMKLIAQLAGRLVYIVLSSMLITIVGGGTTFLRRPVGAIYLLLWALWWAVTFLGRRRGARSDYDRTQRAIVTISGFLSVPTLILAPPWEYAHLAGPLPRDGLLAWAGLIFFAAGIALQTAAMWALRGYYTVRLGIQPSHRLVTSGPYRLVRHPGYLSYLLSLTGVGLAMSSLIGLGLAILVVPFIVWRIGYEEEMLLREFGEEYRAYQRRTRRLIPGLY